MLTLTQANINRIKIYISTTYDILIEDITDADVFIFINEKYNDEIEFSVNTHGNLDHTNWSYIKPRSKKRIASDIIDASYSENDYLAFI